MSGPIVALAPLKDFAQAKGRLAGVLSPVERASLARAMAADVLDALSGCTALDGVVVVTASEMVARFAHDHGARVLPDAGGGLNGALGAALATLAGEGIGRVLVVPGDLPMLTGDAIGRVAGAAGDDAVVIAEAAKDGGTNALLLPTRPAFPFAFGRMSAQAHAEAALRLGHRVVALELAEFTLDIDTPADLARLQVQRCGAHTRAVLGRLDHSRRLDVFAMQKGLSS